MADIQRLDSTQADFAPRYAALIDYDVNRDTEVRTRVAGIIAQVRERGDAAVLEYTRALDNRSVDSMDELCIDKTRMHGALESIPAVQREALEQAAQRLRTYAEQQKIQDWSFTDEHGNRLGQAVRALDRAGVYAPGGKAAYPSTVLMNAIPAKVAGVGEIVLTSPSPGGEVSPLVLAAAALAGVDKMLTIGGAQAVAALAYGTESVPMVDKIVGPGNAYVAAAKRQVFGQVGIESIAGPSEVLIIADGTVDPDWMAVDLFAQAEHDQEARALLMCADQDYLDAVAQAITRLLPQQARAEIIQASLGACGALIKVRDLDEAVALSNQMAPEHLELAVAQPETLLEQIRHAGAVFLGGNSPEAFGDYCAGPNHVLPTGRTARFSSPLGVYDFQKRISVIHASAEGARHLSPIAATLAHGEGLQAHALSAELRGRVKN